MLILFARALDVTLGTLRYIMVARGNLKVAPILGFVESFLWILIMTRILRDGLGNPVNIVAYALGFALGTYTGIRVEERLSIGTVMVRLIVSRNPLELVTKLRSEGYRITEISGEGFLGNVSVFLVLIKRQRLSVLLESVLDTSPEAFYTVEDVRSFAKGGLSSAVVPAKHATRTPTAGEE